MESARRQAQALSPGDKASVIPDERLAEGREDLAAIQATDKANQALKNEGFTVRIGDEIVLLDDANEPITGQLIDRNEGGLFVRFPVQGDIPITTRLSKANLTGKSDGTDATTLHLPTGLLRGRMTQIDNADALISARPTLSRTVLGDDIAITATGRKVPVETAIVNIDDLIPSRTEDGNKNPDYPAALRPTARTPLERMTQIVAIANQADPERLDGDPRASDGAPIVSDDGFVESGSLRVLGLKMAYQQGKADRYRQHLIDQGYDVEGVAKPILVRIQTKRMPLEERARIMTEANDRSLDPLFNPPPAATPVLPDSDAPPLRGPPLSQDKANQRLQPVAGFLKELGVTVRVINRSKLPESKPGQTKGYTDGSTLFVVADAHQNPGDLLATVARQLIGVMGLEHTMPENDWNLLQEQIKKTVKASEVAKRLMEQAKQTHNAADDPSMTKAFFVEAVQSDSLDSRTENLLAWTRLRINRQLQAMGLSRPLPVNDINKTMGEQQEYAPLRNSNQSMFRRAINATPIDWVLRLPFEFFGGLDNESRWVIGQQAYTKIVNFVQNARFDDSVPFNRALNKLLQRARVEVIDRYELPDDYKAMDRQRQIDHEALLDQGEALAKQILGSELSRTESEALHAAVTGRGLPPNAVEGLSKDIIHAIDDMGQRAVLTGMLPLDAYMRNRGAYLHRMYKQHETDSAQGFFYQLFQSAARKIRGNQFKGRGKFERVKLDNLRKHLGDNAEINDGDQFQLIESLSEETGHVYARHFIPVGQQTPQGIRVSRNQGIWTVRKINGNKAIVWRDYTDAELQEMGEIRDPAYTVAKTISLMAKDVSTGEFFADIAKDPNLAREEEPAKGTWRQASEYTRKEWGDINIEWVQVPETKIRDSQTKHYGKLAGLYVRPAIWRDITAIEDSNKASLWRDILAMWKRNMTVYSPVVHVNNIASNFVMMYMADVRAVDFISAIRSFAKKDSLYQEARANRILQNNFAAHELNTTVIEPFLKELDPLAQDADTVKGQLAFLLKMYGGLGKVWKSTVGLYTDGMQKAYRFEDSLGRLAVYISARNKGLNVERAADLSITQMLDYDIRAPGINGLLARGGLLPFISYSYRASTRMTEALFVRPWKFMVLMSVLYGVERLFYAMRGDDEEDRDQQSRLLRETEQGRLFGIGPKRMFPTPMVDEHDNPVNIDIRRFFPLSDVFDQGHSYLPLPAPLTPTGPLVMMFEIFLNRSAFLDKPIVNRLTDTPMEQLVGFADYAYKSWMPSMALIPNSHYNEKVMRALKGGLDPKGHPYTVHQAVLSSLGIKLRPMDTDMMFQWRKRDFDRTERALRHELSLLKYKLGRRMINQDAYKKQVQQLLNKFYRLNKKRMRVLYGKDVEELNGR